MAYIKDNKFYDSKNIEIDENLYNYYILRQESKNKGKEIESLIEYKKKYLDSCEKSIFYEKEYFDLLKEYKKYIMFEKYDPNKKYILHES